MAIYPRIKLESSRTDNDEGLLNLIEFIKSIKEEESGVVQFRGRMCSPRDGGRRTPIGTVVKEAMTTGIGLREGPLAVYGELKREFPRMSKGKRSGRLTDDDGNPIFYYEIP